MLIYEMKLDGKSDQDEALDNAIRTGRFVRNSVVRAWIDGELKSRNDAYKYCKILADNPEFPWARQLNSMARQAHAERAWASIERFYRNCQQKVKGKKGFPKFKKHTTRASVEYKTSGWKLSEDRKYITFTDGFQAGTFRLWGSRDLHYYQLNQIKRVRVIRRCDGYYAQFLIDHTRKIDQELTGRQRGIDVNLENFYTDSEGNRVENPRFQRKAEKKLKRHQRRLSRTKKGSKNRAKARQRLAKAHLKVSRQRKDWVCKLAQSVIQLSDLVAIEDLQVRNMVRNRKLAKSINDASWSMFRQWLEYFGQIYGVPVVAVAPHWTSQDCSQCGEKVFKSLSTRTHKCPHCGYQASRDENSAKNILKKGLAQLANTVGHTEINASGENPLCHPLAIEVGKGTRRKRKLSQ
jgi:putative transposase